MEEKKSLFAMLSPKTAAIAGVVCGFLVLCTIGFIVMGGIYLNNKKISSSTSVTTTVNSDDSNTNSAQVGQIKTVAVTKADKPIVELFIMSYCPYGLQMQKAYLPVMELLKGKADMDIKFVDYIMHEKEEIDENNNQYCIQKEQSDKFIAYAKCFTASGNSEDCLKQANVDTVKLKKCISATDKEFSITANYVNTSTWSGGYYPQYNVHKSLNEKYKVAGSPTLVINGAIVENVNRTPESVKLAVCSSFNSPPEACSTTLSTVAAVAGFGSGAGTDTAGVDCGT